MSGDFPNKINVDMSKKVGSSFCKNLLFWINNFENWLPNFFKGIFASLFEILREGGIEMLRRQKADQSFNVDQRIYDTKKPWVAAKQKDENGPCILDCNQGLALGDFICEIYKSLGKDIIIKKILEQCIVHRNRPNILIGMRKSILKHLEVTKN